MKAMPGSRPQDPRTRISLQPDNHGAGGKTVLVTGAAHGIGKAIATRFAEEEANLALLDSDADGLSALRRVFPGALTLPVDVTDPSAVTAAVDRTRKEFQTVDIVVNNAGRGGDRAFLNIEHGTWEQIIAVNLTGPFLVSQAAARVMVSQQRPGSIVTVASVAGVLSERSAAAYCASKAGVIGLMRSMALDLAAHGIRANTVSPGYTHTESLEGRVGEGLYRHMKDAFDRVPARRLIDSREIAEACLFLASDRASAITGQNIIVDGGLSANLFVVETLPEEWPDG
jgi:NAD(P)-dependent dehydrogenase (short-subunit alcohol dehydrogenase family)